MNDWRPIWEIPPTSVPLLGRWKDPGGGYNYALIAAARAEDRPHLVWREVATGGERPVEDWLALPARPEPVEDALDVARPLVRKIAECVGWSDAAVAAARFLVERGGREDLEGYLEEISDEEDPEEAEEVDT